MHLYTLIPYTHCMTWHKHAHSLTQCNQNHICITLIPYKFCIHPSYIVFFYTATYTYLICTHFAYTPLILYSFIRLNTPKYPSYMYTFCIHSYIVFFYTATYTYLICTNYAHPILYIHTYIDKTHACTLFRVHPLLATRVTPGRLHYVTVPMNWSALYHISHFRIRHVKRCLDKSRLRVQSVCLKLSKLHQFTVAARGLD